MGNIGLTRDRHVFDPLWEAKKSEAGWRARDEVFNREITQGDTF